MPCSRTDAARARQSSCVGMRTPAPAKSAATRSVRGAHSFSMYFAKYSPLAYFESSKPSNARPRSIASVFDARIAWNATV